MSNNISNDGKPITPFTFIGKEEAKQVFTQVKVDPEEREYIVLMYVEENGDELPTFEEKIGRTPTRDTVKINIDTMDIHRSKVLVLNEDGTYSCVSVYDFMKKMEEYFNDGFDIEDYNQGYPENENE